MPDVVLAFSRKDYWTAEKLKGALEGERTKAVLADFVTGKSMDLAAHLASARCFVLLWSEDASAASELRSKLAAAAQALAESKLLIVRLDESELPVGLRDLQMISSPMGPRPRPEEYTDLARKIVAHANSPLAPQSHAGDAEYRPERARSAPTRAWAPTCEFLGVVPGGGVVGCAITAVGRTRPGRRWMACGCASSTAGIRRSRARCLCSAPQK